jgi:tRNA G18 (ribose-2'-O)-methylase SpoU
MAEIPIADLDDPRVALYRNLKDRDLRTQSDAFIVEGRGPLETLLDRSPFEPESLLLSVRAARALADRLAKLPAELPVYVTERDVLAGIVGFDLHRGVLAVCRREHAPTFDDAFGPRGISAGAHAPVVALEALANLDNVGAIFRNAHAFGVPSILLCPRSCDPLYRKAIRTSVAASLCIPFVRASSWPEPLDRLRDLGYTLAALHPASSATAIADWRPPRGRKLALVVGTEGDGISAEALARCDAQIRIPMAAKMNSINVATACAIALHHLALPRSPVDPGGAPP